MKCMHLCPTINTAPLLLPPHLQPSKSSTQSPSMRSLLLILLVSLAVASVQAKKGKGGKPAKKEPKEPKGMCLSEEDMMMICHAGSALGEKVNAAMETCTANAEERAMKGKGKGKGKRKGKGKLPSAPQSQRSWTWLQKNMLERFVSSLSLGGWTMTWSVLMS